MNHYTQLNLEYPNCVVTAPILEHYWEPHLKVWYLVVDWPRMHEPINLFEKDPWKHMMLPLPNVCTLKYNLEHTVQLLLGRSIVINGIRVSVS